MNNSNNSRYSICKILDTETISQEFVDKNGDPRGFFIEDFITGFAVDANFPAATTLKVQRYNPATDGYDDVCDPAGAVITYAISPGKTIVTAADDLRGVKQCRLVASNAMTADTEIVVFTANNS